MCSFDRISKAFYSLQVNFTKNILLLLGINLLIKPIYILGIDAKVQDMLGDESYGVYFALYNFSFLFQIVLDLGIHNYNSKHVSQNNATVAGHFAHVLGLKIVLTVLYFIILIACGWLLGYSIDYLKLLWPIGLVMTLLTFYQYIRSHFSALATYSVESWLSALDKLLMIFFIGYYLYGLKEISIEIFLWGQVFAILTATVIAMILLNRQFTLSVRFSLNAFKNILGKSLPFALVIVLMTMYTRMDGVMLERLLQDEGAEAGRYARGFRLMDAANILGYLFAVLLIPMYARQLKEKIDVSALVRNATGILLSMATLISALCWWYADDIMHLVYSDIDSGHIEIFRLLMVCFWAMSLSYVFGSLISASGELKQLNKLLVLGIIVNWSLNIYLIPKMQAQGAVIATLVTQYLVFIGQILIAHKQFSLTLGTAFISKLVFFLLLTLLIIYSVYNFLSLHWMIESVIAVCLSLFVSFLLGFLRLIPANQNKGLKKHPY